MDKLIFLGTGAAMNLGAEATALALIDEYATFLIDTAGGAHILHQLRQAGLGRQDLTDVFISHAHTDHILGLPWVLRLLHGKSAQSTEQQPLHIYGASETLAAAQKICEVTLSPSILKQFDDRILWKPVSDGETCMVGQRAVTFFDLGAKKMRQFGCYTPLADGSGLTYLGDEPLLPSGRPYVQKSRHLIHEAFCLSENTLPFRPEEIGHSTVSAAAQNAQEMGVKHLILFHSYDPSGPERQKAYTDEASTIFSGRISVPNDLDTIVLTKEIS